MNHFLINSLRAALAGIAGLAILTSCGWMDRATVAAETAANQSEAVAGELLGVVDQRPESGPYVEVDGKFMVPYKERIVGSDVEFEMIPVPGGTFTFGAGEGDEGQQDDELPAVEITVRPMWVAKTEVTWAEYKQFMNMYSIFKEFEAMGSRLVDEEELNDVVTAPTPLYEPTFTYEFGEDPRQPAVTMTQYAAQQYSKWLSLLTHRQYRLPTEVEWEYACRGGTTTAFSWGDDPADADQYAWFYDNAEDGPLQVASKQPNPFGLYDMHGNAAELTVDQYTEDGYQWLVDLLAENPAATATQAANWPTEPWPHVVRGGSWEMDAEELRSAKRIATEEDDVLKNEDPNFPKSPWWFTNDPARGFGFRLFRSYDTLDTDSISRFWDTQVETTLHDVDSRIQTGRGGYGLVDDQLPEAAAELRR